MMNASAEERRACDDGEGPEDQDRDHDLHPARTCAAAMTDEERGDGQDPGNARTDHDIPRRKVVLVDQLRVDAGNRRLGIRQKIGGAVAGEIRGNAAKRGDDGYDHPGCDELAPLFPESEDHQAERKKLRKQRRVIDDQVNVNGAEVHGREECQKFACQPTARLEGVA